MLNQNKPEFGESSSLPLMPTKETNQCHTMDKGFESPATGKTASQSPVLMASNFGSSNTNNYKENCEKVPEDDESEVSSSKSFAPRDVGCVGISSSLTASLTPP